MAVDATRCFIERPKIDHMRWFSAKDQQYAIKYEIGVSLGADTRIVHVSDGYRGGHADIQISRDELKPKLERQEFVIMDKGYQDDEEEQFLSPKKDYPNHPLTPDDLAMNRAIYEKRQIVERVNMRIKIFKAFEHRWRKGHGPPFALKLLVSW
jgi:hypothetical protein